MINHYYSFRVHQNKVVFIYDRSVHLPSLEVYNVRTVTTLKINNLGTVLMFEIQNNETQLSYYF